MAGGSSLYRVVEDTETRLVLRGRKLGLWLMALILAASGLPVLYVGIFELGRRQWMLRVVGVSLGAFFLVCCLATLVLAIRYRAGIEVDREERSIRFLRRPDSPPTVVPYGDVAAVDLIPEPRPGPGGRRLTEYRLVLRRADGDELLIDRSTEREPMAALAGKLADLLATDPRRPAAAGQGAGRRFVATAAQAGPPPGIEITSDGRGSSYRWALLPRSPFWAFFWGFLTLFFGAIALAFAAGTLIELRREPPVVAAAFLALGGLLLAWMYLLSRPRRRQGPLWAVAAVGAVMLANLLLGVSGFIFLGSVAAFFGFLFALCAFVLLGRGQLRVSPAGLESEERVLGLALPWRQRSLAADELARFRIKDPIRGGGAIQVVPRRGRPFTLMIPQGRGAFSRRDLEWLRRRWLRELGREEATG